MMRIPSPGAPVPTAPGLAPPRADAPAAPAIHVQSPAAASASRSPLAVAADRRRPYAGDDRADDVADTAGTATTKTKHAKRAEQTIAEAYFTPAQLEACRQAIARAAARGSSSAAGDPVDAEFDRQAMDLALPDAEPLRACIDREGNWTRLGTALQTRASTQTSVFLREALGAADLQAISHTWTALSREGHPLAAGTVARLFGKEERTMHQLFTASGFLTAQGEARVCAARSKQAVTPAVLEEAEALREHIWPGVRTLTLAGFAAAHGINHTTLRIKLGQREGTQAPTPAPTTTPARGASDTERCVDLFSAAIQRRARLAQRIPLRLPTPNAVHETAHALKALHQAGARPPVDPDAKTPALKALRGVARKHAVDATLLRALVGDDGELTELGRLLMQHAHPDPAENTYLKFGFDERIRAVIARAMDPQSAYPIPRDRFHDLLAMCGKVHASLNNYFFASGVAKPNAPLPRPDGQSRGQITRRIVEEAEQIVKTKPANLSQAAALETFAATNGVRLQSLTRRLAKEKKDRAQRAQQTDLPDVLPQASPVAAQAATGRSAIHAGDRPVPPTPAALPWTGMAAPATVQAAVRELQAAARLAKRVRASLGTFPGPEGSALSTGASSTPAIAGAPRADAVATPPDGKRGMR